MNKKITVTLIVLLSCTALALIAFMIAVMTGAIGGNPVFSGISAGGVSDKLVESNNYDDIRDVNIFAEAADIYIIPHDKQSTTVKIFSERKTAECRQENNRLIINEKNRSGYQSDLFVSKSKIEVYLPKKYDSTLTVQTNYGNTDIGGFKNIIVTAKANAGNITVAECRSAELEDDFGNIKLGTVNEKMQLNNNCGNIEVENAIIKHNSSAKNDMGSIKIGSTNKVHIIADTDMGKVEINDYHENASVTLKLENSMGKISVDN